MDSKMRLTTWGGAGDAQASLDPRMGLGASRVQSSLRPPHTHTPPVTAWTPKMVVGPNAGVMLHKEAGEQFRFKMHLSTAGGWGTPSKREP